MPTMFVSMMIVVIAAAFAPISGRTFAPRSLGITARVGEKHYKVNATTVSDVCKQIFQKSGISQDNQAVSFRGRLLRPSDKLSDVGISVGDTINIMKRRKEALSGTPLSADVLSSEYTNMLRKITENMSPESVQFAMKALEGMISGNNMENLFSDSQMVRHNMSLPIDLHWFDVLCAVAGCQEAARLNALKHIDEYDKLIPGMKAQLMSIASDAKLWKESMILAKLNMKKILQEQTLKTWKNKDSPTPDKVSNNVSRSVASSKLSLGVNSQRSAHGRAGEHVKTGDTYHKERVSLAASRRNNDAAVSSS